MATQFEDVNAFEIAKHVGSGFLEPADSGRLLLKFKLTWEESDAPDEDFRRDESGCSTISRKRASERSVGKSPCRERSPAVKAGGELQCARWISMSLTSATGESDL